MFNDNNESDHCRSLKLECDELSSCVVGSIDEVSSVESCQVSFDLDTAQTSLD